MLTALPHDAGRERLSRAGTGSTLRVGHGEPTPLHVFRAKSTSCAPRHEFLSQALQRLLSPCSARLPGVGRGAGGADGAQLLGEVAGGGEVAVRGRQRREELVGLRKVRLDVHTIEAHTIEAHTSAASLTPSSGWS